MKYNCDLLSRKITVRFSTNQENVKTLFKKKIHTDAQSMLHSCFTILQHYYERFAEREHGKLKLKDLSST